jgi:hypothetical protein
MPRGERLPDAPPRSRSRSSAAPYRTIDSGLAMASATAGGNAAGYAAEPAPCDVHVALRTEGPHLRRLLRDGLPNLFGDIGEQFSESHPAVAVPIGIASSQTVHQGLGEYRGADIGIRRELVTLERVLHRT